MLPSNLWVERNGLSLDILASGECDLVYTPFYDCKFKSSIFCVCNTNVLCLQL